MAQITTTQKIKFTVNPTTEGTSTNPNGVPAPIDGEVAWTLEGNNTSGATLVPQGAQLKEAYFISGDTEQVEALTVKAVFDADVEGEGEVRNIEVTDTMTVIAAEAAGAVLVAGAPEPK